MSHSWNFKQHSQAKSWVILPQRWTKLPLKSMVIYIFLKFGIVKVFETLQTVSNVTRKPVGFTQSCFLSFACTPCHRVHAHHAVMCIHTTPLCAHTPRCVHAHHTIMCVHTMSCVCTPRHHVCAHHIMCMHTMLLCVHTPRCVRAHHAIMCAHTTSCVCTPHHRVCTHHIVCMHTTLCTPCHGVHFSQISLQSHVTTHLSQSEDSILSNLSDLVRNCEISPKIFPPFKEQSCYNSSAKNEYFSDENI